MGFNISRMRRQDCIRTKLQDLTNDKTIIDAFRVYQDAAS